MQNLYGFHSPSKLTWNPNDDVREYDVARAVQLLTKHNILAIEKLISVGLFRIYTIPKSICALDYIIDVHNGLAHGNHRQLIGVHATYKDIITCPYNRHHPTLYKHLSALISVTVDALWEG